MKKSILATMTLAILAMVGTSVFSTNTMAQTYGNGVPSKVGINYQLHNQQKRINEGIRSGELTPLEAARLEHKEAAIRQQESLYNQKGYLTVGQKLRLERELNKSSEHIYYQKHDSDRRF